MLSARLSLSLFLAAVVCLAFWQVWLTWPLMEQDRNLELQRSRERLEQIADLAVAQLARGLGNWEFGLRELNSLPPPSSLREKLPTGGTLVVVSQGTVTVCPRRPLLFVPNPPLAQAQVPRVFDAAEELELREQQYDRAIAALQPLANESATRPEALLRIARIEHKAGQPEAALAAYRRLGSETVLNPSGTPYALLATSAKSLFRVPLAGGQPERLGDFPGGGEYGFMRLSSDGRQIMAEFLNPNQYDLWVLENFVPPARQ